MKTKIMYPMVIYFNKGNTCLDQFVTTTKNQGIISNSIFVYVADLKALNLVVYCEPKLLLYVLTRFTCI